jgi:hypothetical protein
LETVFLIISNLILLKAGMICKNLDKQMTSVLVRRS